MAAPVEWLTDPTEERPRWRCSRTTRWAVIWLWPMMPVITAAGAVDQEEVGNLLRTGRYEECEKQVTAALEGGTRGEEWYALKIRAEMALGKYAAALESLKEATRHYPASLTLFLIGRDVRRFNDLGSREGEAMKTMERHVLS